MNVCQQCRKENPANANFCNNCGAKMAPNKTIKGSNCGSEVPDGNKFCGNCGKPMKTEYTCAKCGTVNPSDNKFCRECGEKAS